jgi:uncharacterized protein with HEPN domain
MNDRDRVRLQHMLEAAVEAAAFIKDDVPQDLAKNRILLLALVKEIEIIGEAAARSRRSFGQILRNPVGEDRMSNRLIHAYSEVSVDLVWSTVAADLPELGAGASGDGRSWCAASREGIRRFRRG